MPGATSSAAPVISGSGCPAALSAVGPPQTADARDDHLLTSPRHTSPDGGTMPAQQFTVHVDPDVLARQDLSVAVPVPTSGTEDGDRAARVAGTADEHHGAHDGRQAARQQSGRARSGRASGTGGGRAYAFRRS